MADKRPVTVFVGSSTEHRMLADIVQLRLTSKDIRVVPWYTTFGAGSATLESLEEQLGRSDFAVLILAPDDVTISRDTKSPSPRDNVLFELGLFMGRLGRKRAFYLFDKTAPARLPTDLAGITGIGYTGSDDLDTALGPACTEIRMEISKSEPRVKLDPDLLQGFARHQAMRDRVQGDWWEFILTDDPSRISFVKIGPDPLTSTVRLRAKGYGADGRVSAVWESTGAILHVDEQRISYPWEGRHPTRPDEPYRGFGDITFAETKGGLDSGTGTFFNINLMKLETTKQQSFSLQRCTPEEVEEMESGDDSRIRKCVLGKLAHV